MPGVSVDHVPYPKDEVGVEGREEMNVAVAVIACVGAVCGVVAMIISWNNDAQIKENFNIYTYHMDGCLKYQSYFTALLRKLKLRTDSGGELKVVKNKDGRYPIQ